MILRRVERFVSWQRVQRWALAGVLVWAAVYAWLLAGGALPQDRFGHLVGGDYSVFYAAGRLVVAGQGPELYRLGIQQQTGVVALFSDARSAGGGYVRYVNPPFYALLFAPLSCLPYLWSFALWSCLSLLCLAGALLALRKHVALLQVHLGTILALSLCFLPAIDALLDGQNSLLSLLLFALLYRSLADRRNVQAGIFAGLGLYKPQLFLLFPLLFLFDKRWRALAAYGATALVLAGLSVAAAGPGGPAAWLRLLASPGFGDALLQPQIGRVDSLGGFADLLLGVSSRGSELLTVALSAVLVASLLWCWRKGAADASKLQTLFAQAVITALLISVHLFDYDLAILILPALLILDAAWRAGPLWRRRALLTVAAVYGIIYVFPGNVGRLQVPVLAMAALYLLALALGHATPRTGAPPRTGLRASVSG